MSTDVPTRASADLLTDTPAASAPHPQPVTVPLTAQAKAMESNRLTLLVDDYVDALEMYETYLTMRGYHVMTARTGADAVQIARTSQPAVILLDLQMPDMSGAETLGRLRADAALRDAHIVAFTARAIARERAAALAAGFDSVLTKPCAPETLAVEIDRWLAAGHRDASA
jgi:two-component system cell cycle response regulator DivK